MRVIERGRNPDAELFEGGCSYCKSQIEAQKHELEIESFPVVRPGEPNMLGRANCPVCNTPMCLYPTGKFPKDGGWPP